MSCVGRGSEGEFDDAGEVITWPAGVVRQLESTQLRGHVCEQRRQGNHTPWLVRKISGSVDQDLQRLQEWSWKRERLEDGMGKYRGIGVIYLLVDLNMSKTKTVAGCYVRKPRRYRTSIAIYRQRQRPRSSKKCLYNSSVP